MRIPHRLVLAAIAACFLLSPQAAPASTFVFQPLEAYRSVQSSETYVELPALLKTNLPAGDRLFVVFDSYGPSDWIIQYCQVSAGICFPDDHEITLRNDSPDTLRVDFIMMPGGSNGVGWADVRIYRVDDPSDWAEASFAVGRGVTLPTPSFAFRSSTAFKQANPYDDVRFRTWIRSYNGFNDSLIVHILTQMPPNWTSEFCQRSTGLCRSERTALWFPAGLSDSLYVNVYPDNPDPGIGKVWIKTQSRANPAFFTTLPFRVRSGSIPSSAEEDGATRDVAVRANPNPTREGADFEVGLRSASTIRLLVADLSGRRVHEQETGLLPAGLHTIRWDGRDADGIPAASGIYFYRVWGDGAAAEGKLVVER